MCNTPCAADAASPSLASREGDDALAAERPLLGVPPMNCAGGMRSACYH